MAIPIIASVMLLGERSEQLQARARSTPPAKIKSRQNCFSPFLDPAKKAREKGLLFFLNKSENLEFLINIVYL